MRVSLEEKRLDATTMLQHGHSTHDVSQLVGTSQCTCCRECVPYVEPSRGGRPRSSTHAQRRVCVRAITCGGLDNVVDVRYPLNEHLNVVVAPT